MPSPEAQSPATAASFGAGLGAALRGMRLGLRTPEVRRSYGKLVAWLLLLGLAFDAGGIFLVLRQTEVALDAPWWVAATWWAVRAFGIALVFLMTPLALLVSARIALPLLAERLFLAALRALDPERARALEARPGVSGWVTAADAVLRLVSFAALSLALFALGLVPAIGPLLAVPAQLYFTARAVSWELLDPYFGRRGLRLSAQRRFVREQRPALLGFGLPLALLLAVPLLGPLLFGLAQAAAAQLVHDALPADGSEPG